MQSVKVQRTGISAEEAVDVLRRGLGDGYQIEKDTKDADGGLLIRKGLARAKVSVRAEHGGTVFDVSGAGASALPLFNVVTKLLNDQGVAKRAAAAIDNEESFRDDG